mgnify:CR=1 FL=1
MDPYQKLANAIIIQAAKDYRAALRKLRSYADFEHELALYEKLVAEKKIKPDPVNERQLVNLKQIKADIKEIEDFFHSHLYSVLTDVNGDYILDGLRKEVGA